MPADKTETTSEAIATGTATAKAETVAIAETLDAAVVNDLAVNLSKLLDAARFRITDEKEAELVTRVTGHLGCQLAHIPNVSVSFGSWEHVNLQLGLDAYLAAYTPSAEWFGVAGGGRSHQDIIDMLADAARLGNFQLGAVDYRTVATGPDSVTEAVQLGLVATTAPDGRPVVLAVRGPQEHRGPSPACQLQIMAATRGTATAVREEVERLIHEHDVFRGGLLQFEMNEYRGNELVSFMVRPELTAEDVILPAGTLDAIERHVVRSREHNDRLTAHGQHLKRGVLLYGPPGTGKTHTVRYLLSRLTGATVVVLSGGALRFLGSASTLVRRLQPAVLVIEDVDLIAQDRSYGPGTNPLLFELLNRIDGIGADADVTFVLTTNRVDVLEKALTERPGRVDLALEIPKPNATERDRLLRLYTKDIDLELVDSTEIVAALDGVTASFVRELVRRAVLRELDRQPERERITLTEASLRETLDELQSERQELTSRILGGAAAQPATAD
ncbi:MAG TPA: ATP-binding protein [Pseudonocardiaceae bacterium]|jgi:AAA+ superfamily predicted ATPase|nr:ATP-binding protein [Pseudonocardiaceae bacterium]